MRQGQDGRSHLGLQVLDCCDAPTVGDHRPQCHHQADQVVRVELSRNGCRQYLDELQSGTAQGALPDAESADRFPAHRSDERAGPSMYSIGSACAGAGTRGNAVSSRSRVFDVNVWPSGMYRAATGARISWRTDSGQRTWLVV